MFISTLAITKLEQQTQDRSQEQQILIDSLSPIVSFLVLCSIMIRKSHPYPYSPIQRKSACVPCHNLTDNGADHLVQWVYARTDGLSIPFFSVARQVHSRTQSLSRTLTARGTEVPDWLLWARRSPPPLPTSLPASAPASAALSRTPSQLVFQAPLREDGGDIVDGLSRAGTFRGAAKGTASAKRVSVEIEEVETGARGVPMAEMDRERAAEGMRGVIPDPRSEPEPEPQPAQSGRTRSAAGAVVDPVRHARSTSTSLADPLTPCRFLFSHALAGRRRRGARAPDQLPSRTSARG